MHNPKISENEVQRFEREVQQKMEELEFSPSAAVWANLEKAIRVEKKRRVPFFWLWFLPALLLVGGAGIYWMTGQTMTSSKGGDKPAGVSQPGKDERTVGNKEGGDRNEQGSNNKLANTSRPVHDDGNTIDEPVSVRSDVPGSNAGGVNPGRYHWGAARNNRANGNINGDHTHSAAKGATSLTKAETAGATNVVEAGTTQGGEGDSRTSTGVGTKAAENPANPLLAAIRLHPVNVKSMAAIQAAPLAKRTALAKALPGSKRPWEAGFTGGVGISSINQSLFKGASVTASDSRNLAAPVPVTSSVSQTYVSKIRPDLSFWAGIFVQKPVLNHLSVSVGLNLHYYSTKVSTGDKVVNSASNYYYSPASSLLSYAAAPTAAQSYPYYAAGDKQSFINRYYFLEIPGSIQWQITHTRILPLFWEVGGTLSYLMSSNAIYYNTKAGVYYKDGQVANRTQFNLSTALMVSLPLKGFQMQVGPQLQYGATSLLNSESSGGQHLFYGGIKLVIFPGKSHKSGQRFFHGQ